MGKSKKLNLSMEELKGIAKAINENTIANKSRAKEEKIPTDIFIKQFGINRKDFSETIKDTLIKYNPSTFLYDIPESDTKVKQECKSELNIVDKPNNNSDTLVTPLDIETDRSIVEFENMKSELVEMLQWYKEQRGKENIIDIEIPQIKIDLDRFKGEGAITRGFKIYPALIAEFKEFCNEHSEYTMQDLQAMALIEYMKRYKK